MAQLALGLAGAAVGSLVGMPQLGWAIGSMLGATIARPDQPAPKAGTVAPPQVQYGWPMPRYDGINRVVPWVAWQYELEPVPVEVETKGSSSQTVGYQNYVHLLLILGEQTSDECELLRVWRNKEMAATWRIDAEPEDLARTVASPYWESITLYPGGVDQLPDPVYEAIVGAADAVAYVGRIVVVISRALCEGTSVPQFEFEIAVGPRAYTYAVAWTASTTAEYDLVGSASYAGRPQRVPLMIPARFTAYDPYESYFVATNFDSKAEAMDLLRTQAAGYIESTGTTLLWSDAGTLSEVIGAGSEVQEIYVFEGAVHVMPGDTIQLVTRGFGIAFPNSQTTFERGTGFETLANPVNAAMPTLEDGQDEATIIWGASQDPWVMAAVGGFASGVTRGGPAGVTTDYLTAGDYSSRYCQYGGFVYIGEGAVSGPTTGVVRKFVVGVSAHAAESAALPLQGSSGCYFSDIACDGTTVWIGTADGIEPLNVSDLTSAGATIDPPGGPGPAQRLVVNSSNYLHHIDGNMVHRWTGTEWELDIDFTGSGIGVGSATHTPGYENQTLYITVGDGEGRVLLRTVDGEGTDVNTILLREWLRSGIQESQIDLSETVGIPLIGSGPLTQSAAVITDRLATYGSFTTVVQEQLRTVLLGQASVATIDYDQLGAGVDESSTERVEPDLGAPVETPKRYALSAIDGEADHQTLTVQDNLLIGPSPQVTTVDLPLVITPERAQGVVDTVAASARTASSTFKTSVALCDYPEEDLGDVVTLDYRGEALLRVSLRRETLADWVRSFEGPFDEQADYIPDGLTSAGAEPSLVVSGTGGAAEVIPIDGPLLRDADNGNGDYLAMDMAGAGATVYRSADGLSYTPGLTFGVDATVGSLTTELTAWDGHYVWDNRASFTVELTGGTLSSSTKAAMHADASINHALIGSPERGWLHIRFVNAALVAANTYDIDTILYCPSGGTEEQSLARLPGERFILLNTLGGVRPDNTLSAAEAGQTRYVKAVTPGRTVSGAPAVAYEFNNIKAKPLAPVRLGVTRDLSGNAVFTCTPRTRLATRWGGSGGSLMPDSEGGVVLLWELYTNPGFGTIARALTTYTADCPYTAAEQTADGLTPGDRTAIRVYKIGTSGQRGYVLQGTV